MRIALALTCLLVNRTAAAQILVAEIGFGGGFTVGTYQVAPPPLPTELQFVFGVNAPDAAPVFWRQTTTAANLGMTFTATPEVTIALADMLASCGPNGVGGWFGRLHMGHMPGGVTLIPLENRLDSPSPVRVEFHVPLDAVQIDRIERTIQLWEVFASNNEWGTAGAQTIRLFGHMVPEPTTWALMICAASLLTLRRRFH